MMLTLLATVGRLLLLGYLPGALVFRLPLLDRDRRAGLPAEERAFWSIVISVAITSVIALMLAAAGQYSLERVLLADAIVVVVIAVAANRRLRLPGEAPRVAWTAIVPLALVMLGVWLYFPTSEYIIGGKDPGTYMNEGIQIAQRGSLVIRDPVVAAVPPGTRDLFFPSHDNPTYHGTRFMGFFILDPASGSVLGQFPHLFPVWIAIGYGLDGLSGARDVVAWWSLLALLAVYVTGRHLAGTPAAAAGTALLAINVAYVWYSRYPNAELPMAALMLSGLLAFDRAHADGDRFFAPVAGVLLALLLFLRFDAVLAVAAVAMAVVLRLPYGRWLDPWFGAAAGAGLAVAALYLLTTMQPYMALPIIFISNLQVWHVAGLVALATTVLGLGVLARRTPVVAARARLWVPRVLVAALVLMAAYAFFYRSAGGRLAPHDAAAFRTFGSFYLSVPGLAAAVVGLALLVGRSFWRHPALLLATAVFGAFFFYKIRIVPDHFWMTRRFLPIILPMATLSMAALAFWRLGAGRDPAAAEAHSAGAAGGARGHRGAPHPVAFVVPVLFLVVMAGHYARAAAPVIPHVEYAGLIPRLEALAERFGDDDLVLVESRNASDIHVLAVPLAYVYARNVLVLFSPRPDKATFLEFLTWARTRYRDVYFIGGGGTDLLSRSIGVTAVGSERFQVPEYASVRNGYPTTVRRKEFDFGIYRFVEPRPDPAWFSLDVGTMDDLHVVRLHAKEQAGDVTFRWTRDVSYIEVLGVQDDSRIVTLWLADGGRPSGVDRAQVDVTLEGVDLGSVVVGSQFEPYTFTIPADLASTLADDADPARLMLETNTWNPAAVASVGDDRDLGVMVDRVEVR